MGIMSIAPRRPPLLTLSATRPDFLVFKTTIYRYIMAFSKRVLMSAFTDEALADAGDHLTQQLKRHRQEAKIIQETNMVLREELQSRGLEPNDQEEERMSEVEALHGQQPYPGNAVEPSDLEAGPAPAPSEGGASASETPEGEESASLSGEEISDDEISSSSPEEGSDAHRSESIDHNNDQQDHNVLDNDIGLNDIWNDNYELR